MRKSSQWICLSVLAASLLFATGCGRKAPAEANACLKGALDALAKDDAKAFTAAVLPAQQGTLSGVPEMASFFSMVMSHEINNDLDTNVTDDSATIMTTLYFDKEQKAYCPIAFVMKKADAKWYVDLAKTIEQERGTNSAYAFQPREIVLEKK